MYATKHDAIEARRGEYIKIAFTITDNAGTPVSLAGAALTYKIGRRLGDEALLELELGDGISVSGNVATVEFYTDAVVIDAVPALGDFIGQLFVTKDSKTLMTAEGPLEIKDTVH